MRHKTVKCCVWWSSLCFLSASNRAVLWLLLFLLSPAQLWCLSTGRSKIARFTSWVLISCKLMSPNKKQLHFLADLWCYVLRSLILYRRRRFINYLLTYLLTYLLWSLTLNARPVRSVVDVALNAIERCVKVGAIRRLQVQFLAIPLSYNDSRQVFCILSLISHQAV